MELICSCAGVFTKYAPGMNTVLRCAFVLSFVAAVNAQNSETSKPATAPGSTPSPVKFVGHRLNQFRSEAVGVADFNRDGHLDIVAGAFLYPAPDFKPVKIRTLSGLVDEQGKGYVDDFMNLPLDVDGDGQMDVVSCGWFCTCIRWYRNSLKSGGEWPEQLEEKSVNFEAGELVDIDGDGKAQEITRFTRPRFPFGNRPASYQTVG